MSRPSGPFGLSRSSTPRPSRADQSQADQLRAGSSQAGTPRARSSRIRLLAVLAATALGVTVLGACGSGDSGAGKADTSTVVVATHDSWSLPEEVLAAFESESGYQLKIQQQGDAGELTNKLVLTKDSPIADAVFGIDNTFATRAVDGGVLEDFAADLPTSAEEFRLDGEAGDQLTPVDFGDVCVNVDDRWFADHDRPAPRTLDDLTEPAYRDLFVVPAASTSSPGLAFLAATIAAKGDAWTDYWRALIANGTKVVPGWTEAYEGEFTAGGGKGTRPIVVSYSSSPPFTIPEGTKRPTTSALLDTCFRQVEYAGVLAGADNPAGAEAFVQFLLSRQVQQALPDSMYVYPVDTSTPLPKLWARWARVAPQPYTLPADELAAQRSDWVAQWRDIVTG